MSKWYQTAKKNYQSGKWSLEMLRNVLERGRITREEFDEITRGADVG